MVECTNSKTLRIKEKVANQELLFGGGSTHNFIQNRIVKFLGLPIKRCNNFQVMVGNRDACIILANVRRCHNLGSHSILHRLLHFTPSRAEILLWVQWLKALGPVLADYSQLTMQLTWDNGYAKSNCRE